MRTFQFALSLVVFVLLSHTGSAYANRIEAQKGKSYQLTKSHGPWMIMVASLAEPSKEWKKDGLSPAEAAEQLVYELRKKGIPAYTFSRDEVIDKVNTTDQQGRFRQRSYVAQQDRVCVIAGNYPSTSDKKAQLTLDYIKKLEPKSWKENGIYRRTPGRPGPLSGAFLTINPLLTPEEVKSRTFDPMVLRLNSGERFSVLENKGKYTLVVATFQGKSVTKVGASKVKLASAEFDEKLKSSISLDDAALSARQLVSLLRNTWKMEAYIMHDRFSSIVTVGAFDSESDPRIRHFSELFGAKFKKVDAKSPEALTAEIIALPGPTPDSPPERTIIFDPKPRLIEVPRFR